MPRAPGSSKRQQGAASHRDNRHENGLVGSAKRSSDKKGSGLLDNSLRRSDQGTAGVAGAAGAAGQSTPVNGHANSPYKQCVYDASNDSRTDDLRRSSLDAVSEMSSDSSNANGLSGVEAGHRQIDVNAMKNADVHRDSGPFDLATTVLKSLPMQDTLAILIILMHVPSLSLTVIYTIFTFLTFVPPVATSSGMSINLAEIFDGNSTMPSLVTVLCVDFFFLLIWLFLWGPIQDAILDFAKPVIAITLGGGTSARDGTSRGLTTCFMWVIGHHLLRGTKAHWGRVARHIPEHWRLPQVFNNPVDSASSAYDKMSAYGWIRSVLAIHILTQGIVRYIREWYLRREKANASVGASDPEAGKPPSVISDTANEGGFATPDTEAGLNSTSTVPTSKKRRKQSTQVRLQQPLWAALASTKIVVVKEYELSHAASESAGTNATDIHNLGNAPFNNQPNQIWISYIGSDEVCFNTSHFPEIDDDEPRSVESSGEDSRPANIDTSKPFYVRVNNAVWQPTRMFPIEESPGESHEGVRWTGDIYGLRPASKYVCEFVDSQTDEVLFSTSIRTVQATQREADGVPPPVANGQRSLHPDSPALTLRTSIAAVEAKLSEERSRLKTLRKEYKNRANALKKDNELTDNQLSSAGNHDEKYRQKIRQQETQKAQAERDTQQLADQLKNFDTAPELGERKKKVEKQYSSEKKVFEAAQKAFKEFKSGLEKEIKAKEVEKSNLNTRRNKVATRIAKVENELANITDANNRGLDEAERRNQERSIWQGHVAGIEANYNERLAHVRANNANKSEEIRHLQMQLQSFHEYINSNGMSYDMMPPLDAGHSHLGPPFQPTTSSTWNPDPTAPPHYPTGLWSASDNVLPSASAPTLPSMSPWQPPPTAPPFEPRMTRSRGRSSSMLSNVSGFTQSSGEEYASPPMDSHRVKHIWASRTRASGGGSSGSGSNGDPTSPR
ncbi:uncharacterized protein FPRO_11710 [Fusarium proliferatum ET1]|uniref:Ubiquitination network signaling protein acrB n=2 Tax=Gibberella intermedia TaxID=948311 RepID=A0A1L7W0U9_FUSPR|nr:uncharacterized protein FPRO_11710 [Fusarium proliferatum ET1]CZR46263.1 uncharacterized protein FPRO_11710 [Fusarium proliferatum ET1]